MILFIQVLSWIFITGSVWYFFTEITWEFDDGEGDIVIKMFYKPRFRFAHWIGTKE
jgi:hypothetical protein